MTDLRVASRYAKSLLELAEDKNALEEVHKDMRMFSGVCQQNYDLVLMLKNPVIKHDKKKAVLDILFKDKVNPLTTAIFDIISRKNREAFLPAIAKEFHNLYNTKKGIRVASVSSAVPLSNELRQEIEKLVQKINPGKKVHLEERVDESLIGGYVLKVGDQQIDDSLKTKLKTLQLKFSQNPYIKEF